MKKQRWIAVSCTTLDALTNCIREQCRVIAIEEPLYSQGKALWENLDGIKDYSSTEYPSMYFIILVKTRGAHKFIKRQHEVYYFPLHGHRS